MDKINVVGLRDVSFKDKKTGHPVSGTSVFYTTDDEYVTGVAAGKLFVSSYYCERMPYFPAVGDQCFVYYNRYGKPAGFERVGK